MHWLIPLVSHSASCAYGILGRSITPVALAVSIALVTAQSFHHWGGFYITFATFFLTSNGLTIISRYTGTSSLIKAKTPRNAVYLLATALLPAVLVLAHQYYLTQRLKVVKWFLIERAPGGCLPIPSRTIYEPWIYKFHDAIGNNLPWGIVAIYAIAMSTTFSNSLGSPKALSITNILFGSLGALLIGFTAAYSLPMCDGTVESAEHVTASVDRGPEWGERTPMEWSIQARYRIFPAAIAVIGILGVLLEHGITKGLVASTSKSPKPSEGNGNVKKGKQGAKAYVQRGSDGNEHLATFLMSLVVTLTVVLGMAVWSYVGAMPRGEDAPGFPGFS
ncbi:hypothetical protein M409DRAFT_49086 [Zasmidium cellare ATCC 36951]|uniref:Uncharacterized protein n=1 Tax=Zasmidium cellare ATCC 36951 TaxID=1080233 RepID=A0A6A6D499_ZASCE|nr:uncharacterized protein M409DRAFT_49086 [Zasmidium cellare ATCC 36951]KAF2174227.1 hypothetical protein M409DRAFT_49086 [Zasmidium cellare ATCC 36951]